MVQVKLVRLAGAIVAIVCAALPVLAGEPMTLGDYMALNGPAPTGHIAYGPAPLQYAELFEPTGVGPFPVVVLIHGGCFMNRYQGMAQMRGMAGALAAKGVAVWSIEYRRIRGHNTYLAVKLRRPTASGRRDMYCVPLSVAMRKDMGARGAVLREDDLRHALFGPSASL